MCVYSCIYTGVSIVGSEIYDFYDVSFCLKTSSGNPVMTPGVSKNITAIRRRFREQKYEFYVAHQLPRLVNKHGFAEPTTSRSQLFKLYGTNHPTSQPPPLYAGIKPIRSWQGGYRSPAPPVRAFGHSRHSGQIIGGDSYRGYNIIQLVVCSCAYPCTDECGSDVKVGLVVKLIRGKV